MIIDDLQDVASTEAVKRFHLDFSAPLRIIERLAHQPANIDRKLSSGHRGTRRSI